MLLVGAAAILAGLAAFWAIRWALPRPPTLAEAVNITVGAIIFAGVVAAIAVGCIIKRGSSASPGQAAPPAEAETEPGDDQKLLGHIIDSVEASVMTISSAGTVTSFSAVAEKALGYEAKAVVGQHFGAVFPNIPENRVLRDMIISALTAHRTRSSVEVNAATSDGSTVALGVTISLLRGEGGRHRGIVLTFKDLAELKQLREQIKRTDQLASLGRLAAGMAHEIRNPLGSLQGLVELIQEDFREDDPKRRYTSTILRTMDQLNTLVEDLLDFSHPPMTHVEPHDVRDLVRESVQFCTFEHRGRPVALHEDYTPEPICVRADRETLARAIVNIVRNAFQATPDNGTVAVSVRRQTAPKPGTPEQVLVAVANSGPHVSPEDRDKLFTPFFTTKPKGTGLGLPIAHQIITAHSGQIEVESEPDSGTTFSIILPIEPAGAEVPVEENVRDAAYDREGADR